MNIDLNILPGDIIYYRVTCGAALAAVVGKVVSISINITETTENKVYLISGPGGNINIPEGNITKDRKVAMHWLSENLETQIDKYTVKKAPTKAS